jgi:glucose 1-dehydrogenase
MSDPFAPFRVTGRTALVTGARREIGRAIALGLAGAGARLAIHHAGTTEEASDAAAVVREIQAIGGEAAAFGQDFARDDAGHHLAAAVTRWAPIDILVLNASIELPEDFRAITRERFDQQIAVNLRTTMELLQTLLPPMAERGWGRVVTIGSVQQERPHPAMFVYAGTKAAQLNWTLSLAREFGGQGVTVNNLAPGAILTARNRDQMAVRARHWHSASPPGALAGRTIWWALRCCCAPRPAATSTGSICSWMVGGWRCDDWAAAPTASRSRLPEFQSGACTLPAAAGSRHP